MVEGVDWLLNLDWYRVGGAALLCVVLFVAAFPKFSFFLALKLLLLALILSFIGALTLLCYAAGWLSSPVAVLLFIIVLVLSYIALLMRRRLNNEARAVRQARSMMMQEAIEMGEAFLREQKGRETDAIRRQWGQTVDLTPDEDLTPKEQKAKRLY